LKEYSQTDIEIIDSQLEVSQIFLPIEDETEIVELELTQDFNIDIEQQIMDTIQNFGKEFVRSIGELQN
jgi:hypothetical protein